MKYYEVTAITKNEDDIDNIIKLVKDLTGTISDTRQIGNRRFSYPIDKQTSGYYQTVVFELDPSFLVKLENQLKAQSYILRYLLISKRIGTAINVVPEKTKSDEITAESSESAVLEVKKEAPVEIEAPEAEPAPTEPKKSKKKTEEAEEKVEEVKEESVVKEEKETPAKPKKAAKPKVEKETEVSAETEVKEVEDVKVEETEKSKPAAKTSAKADKPETSGEDEEERLKKLNEKLDELLKD